MGLDYALVYARVYHRSLQLTDKFSSHLYYNVPPAVLLTACYFPLCTKIDVYKVLFLIVVSLLLSSDPTSTGLPRLRSPSYPLRLGILTSSAVEYGHTRQTPLLVRPCSIYPPKRSFSSSFRHTIHHCSIFSPANPLFIRSTFGVRGYYTMADACGSGDGSAQSFLWWLYASEQG